MKFLLTIMNFESLLLFVIIIYLDEIIHEYKLLSNNILCLRCMVLLPDISLIIQSSFPPLLPLYFNLAFPIHNFMVYNIPTSMFYIWWIFLFIIRLMKIANRKSSIQIMCLTYFFLLNRIFIYNNKRALIFTRISWEFCQNFLTTIQRNRTVTFHLLQKTSMCLYHLYSNNIFLQSAITLIFHFLCYIVDCYYNNKKRNVKST